MTSPHPVGLFHLQQPFCSLKHQLSGMKKASRTTNLPFCNSFLEWVSYRGSHFQSQDQGPETDTSKQTNVLCSSPHSLCCCSPRGSPQLVQHRKHHKQVLKSSSWASDTPLAEKFVPFSLGDKITSDAGTCHHKSTSPCLRATANTIDIWSTATEDRHHTTVSHAFRPRNSKSGHS